MKYGALSEFVIFIGLSNTVQYKTVTAPILDISELNMPSREQSTTLSLVR
jgi:hypothetical protein